MPRDTGIADRLRAFGLTVVEVDGWQQRGRTYADFAPLGSVNHHTAGPRNGDGPSLGICINGRSDLPGPLCNVFGSRSLVAYVVAAGVANHAGPGGWSGLKGNQRVFGLEMENAGTSADPGYEALYEFMATVHAALISGLGSPDPALVCEHFEWSTQGKIDFHDWPGADLRARVARILAAHGAPPLPPPPAGVLAKAQWFYGAGRKFTYGDPGDLPLLGDWDGDGHDAQGVRRGATFHLADTLGGATTRSFSYGDPGDIPIVGDWDGDGRDGVGVVRGNVFYLRNALTSGNAEQVLGFGNPGDAPLAGRWKAGQRCSVGVHRGSEIHLRDPDTGAVTMFHYGDPGDRVIMGDWNGDGVDTPAVVRGNEFLIRDSNTDGTANRSFRYGDPGDIPLPFKTAGVDGVLVAR